jgi:proteasome lid subunit RPN8/RPN11
MKIASELLDEVIAHALEDPKNEVCGVVAVEGDQSHVRSAPYPSQTDIGFAANWPGVEWIIVGLADGQVPKVRSYLIEDGRVLEVELEVE